MERRCCVRPFSLGHTVGWECGPYVNYQAANGFEVTIDFQEFEGLCKSEIIQEASKEARRKEKSRNCRRCSDENNRGRAPQEALTDESQQAVR